jgi:hypothetical protein
MENKTFNDYSTQNYDNLLIGWASRPVKPNLTISFGTIRRTSASANAITILTSSPNFWTIIDGEYEILLTHNDIIVNNYGIINDGQFIQTGQKKLEF